MIPIELLIDEWGQSVRKMVAAARDFIAAASAAYKAVLRDMRRLLGIDAPEPMSRAERRTAASRRAQRARNHGASDQRALAQERRGWIT
ncbi:MAG: hypothetical protein WBA46_00205 [Thermomicrobiales bacterium]